MHQKSWYSHLPHNWSIGVSDNGWITNEIGIFWLQSIFEKYTKDCTIGQYRLLILDSHGSHMTPEFDQYCLAHSIIVLCMPPHSSHLLQLLDIGCFSVLKRSYGNLVEQKMILVSTILISSSFFHSISKHELKHYLKATSKVAFEQQVPNHINLMLYYRFFPLNTRHHHRHYLHSSFHLARYG
jgi:hypothetical protein